MQYDPDDVHTVRWAGFDMPVPYHSDLPGVSMGEGNTPVVRLPRIAEYLGTSNLYGKLEFMNPTGSFKDRGTATMLSMAVEQGVAEVVEDSSGNAG
ncbi:MAG: pyridoxal-phosphate dependent enzyme, partial [Dehalococcoidia bacterium]|nr:pyridoxal-phosphate dependent enzyme [Dehalococcoidia bacterium]